MLQLEHLNLVVRDIQASVRFYQAAMPHWRIRAEGKDEWYGKPRRWLHFGDNYQYLTLNDNGEGAMREREGHQVGVAHLGLVVENLPALEQRLEAAGFTSFHRGNPTPFRENRYFLDPDGFEVEFVQYRSDLPVERNS